MIIASDGDSGLTTAVRAPASKAWWTLPVPAEFLGVKELGLTALSYKERTC